MRKLFITLTLALCAFSTACLGQTNRDARVDYVLKNLGVKREVQMKLKPLLYAYLEEKKKANEDYDALKTKLKANIKSETITNEQASSLLTKKWTAETKETAVKKKYTEKFETIISAKKTYKCFNLLNDSKSKVQGKAKQKDYDEEDDD